MYSKNVRQTFRAVTVNLLHPEVQVPYRPVNVQLVFLRFQRTRRIDNFSIIFQCSLSRRKNLLLESGVSLHVFQRSSPKPFFVRYKIPRTRQIKKNAIITRFELRYFSRILLVDHHVLDAAPLQLVRQSNEPPLLNVQCDYHPPVAHQVCQLSSLSSRRCTRVQNRFSPWFSEKHDRQLSRGFLN